MIVTYGGAALVLKQATTSIPSVFAIAIDPLASGLVASLSHPGGNVTGLSLQQSDTSGRRLEVLRELVERFQSSNHMGCPKRPHSVDGKPKMQLSGFMELVV